MIKLVVVTVTLPDVWCGVVCEHCGMCKPCTGMLGPSVCIFLENSCTTRTRHMIETAISIHNVCVSVSRSNFSALELFFWTGQLPVCVCVCVCACVCMCVHTHIQTHAHTIVHRGTELLVVDHPCPPLVVLPQHSSLLLLRQGHTKVGVEAALELGACK